jgi:hypothetical protein
MINFPVFIKDTDSIMCEAVTMWFGLIASCVGTAFYYTLLKEKQKGREDEEEDVNRYQIPLRKRDDTEQWNRKQQILLCEGLA